ncbi:hypothetical protein NIP51_000684 [Campylobacter jejuni]|nr:hypothetical protein [Campylobacter jejuni]
MKNITLTKIPIGEGKEPCLNSKKIVLSLATISFLASCANAKLNSEIKTYDEVKKMLKLDQQVFIALKLRSIRL